MNCDVSKSSTSTDHNLNSKTVKKSKRKRRRNKLKYSNLRNRKKYHKKFNNKSDFFASLKPNIFQFINNIGQGSRQVMSSWYWSNYKKAIEWQDKHKIAHWKACALALQEENKYLLQIINNMQPGLCPKLPVTSRNLEKNFNIDAKLKCDKNVENDRNNDEDDEDDEEEIEYEISDEMIQFFEQSFKHKMDMEKLKEEKEEFKDAEEEVKQIQSVRMKRSSEMQLLYGEEASTITGMETAVQLSYEKYCDTKSPKYWPNIPFRL